MSFVPLCNLEILTDHCEHNYKDKRRDKKKCQDFALNVRACENKRI
jgi:hypothetical protein